MNLPFEVYLHMVEYLPDAKLLELWCTGRELHAYKWLYNKRILPQLRLRQWHTFLHWMHRCGERTIHLTLDAGPVQGLYIATKCDTFDVPNFPAFIIHRICIDAIISVMYEKEPCGSIVFSFHWDDNGGALTALIGYRNDDLGRKDEVRVMCFEYGSCLGRLTVTMHAKHISSLSVKERALVERRKIEIMMQDSKDAFDAIMRQYGDGE